MNIFSAQIIAYLSIFLVTTTTLVKAQTPDQNQWHCPDYGPCLVRITTSAALWDYQFEFRPQYKSHEKACQVRVTTTDTIQKPTAVSLGYDQCQKLIEHFQSLIKLGTPALPTQSNSVLKLVRVDPQSRDRKWRPMLKEQYAIALLEQCKPGKNADNVLYCKWNTPADIELLRHIVAPASWTIQYAIDRGHRSEIDVKLAPGDRMTTTSDDKHFGRNIPRPIKKETRKW